MKKYILSICVALMGFMSFGQIPQNINPGTENKESLWESPTTIVVVVVFILLIIVSRTWAKRILRKRDELTGREKEDEEGGDVEGK